MSALVNKLLRQAQRQIKAGQLREAEELYRYLLSKFPKNRRAIQGYEQIKQAIKSNSQSGRTPQTEILQELFSLYNRKQFKQLLYKLESLNTFFPKNVDLYNLQGAAYAGLGRPEMAIESYETILKINPQSAETYYNIGVLWKNMSSPEAAIDNYRKAIRIKPDYAEAYYNLGNAFKEMGEVDLALQSYKQVLKSDPESAAACNNIGVCLQAKGEVAAALEIYEKALEIDSGYAKAHRNISSIKRYEVNDPQIKQLQSLYRDPAVGQDDRCHLCFALAKVFEDLGHLREAFKFFEEGNAYRKKILSYDIQSDEKQFARLKQTEVLNSHIAPLRVTKSAAIVPIFVLGMPRSGTTLVEQILSSHSELIGAGELPLVAKFAEKIATGQSVVDEISISRFREQYLKGITALAHGNRFVVDKMPHNFKFIGLICRALPEAKIIHVKRDAAATCWSNFKNYFSADGLGYSYDLEDVVKFYYLYDDLMRFWSEHHADRLYNLDYDQLTVSQETETRRLIAYLGLEWQQACLAPQNNYRSVSTASQHQVRKAVYVGSSEKWRQYEPFLNGAFDALTEMPRMAANQQTLRLA